MEEIDLKQLFELFWEKKGIIIAIVLLCAIIGGVYTMFFVTPKYQSSTTLVLVSGNSSTSNSITASDVTLNSNLVSTYGAIITSDSVLSRVISNLNLRDIDVEKLKKNIEVSEVQNAEVLKISVMNEDSDYAYRIANEIAVVFIERAEELYNINNVRVLDEAKLSETPANVNHVKDIIIFTFIGIVIAVAYVIIANMLDNSVKSSEAIEKNMKLPVLATIPIKQNDKRRGGKK